MPETIRFAYDCELDRPACAVVAAGLGADTRACSAFEAKTWLTFPTEAMRVYEATPEQVAILAARVNAREGA